MSNRFVLVSWAALLLIFVFCVFADEYTTPKLGLDRMVEGQVNADVIYNQFLDRMDALTFPVLTNYPANASPVANDAVNGDLFIVPANGEGDWDNHDGELAFYINDTWTFPVVPDGGIIYGPLDVANRILQKSFLKSTYWYEVEGQEFLTSRLGNMDSFGAINQNFNLFINYDSSLNWSSSGPVQITEATSGNNVFSINRNDDEEYDLYLGTYDGGLSSLAPVRLSSYRDNAIDADAYIRSASGFKVGSDSIPYTGTIESGSAFWVVGGIIMGAT